VLALVFFFSTFMGNMLTILVTLMIYFLSHSFSLLLDMAMRSQNAITQYFVQTLQLLFPPFEALNIKDVIGSFTNFHPNFFLFNSAYSLVYLALILLWTILIFNKKKFES
jgi:hypothetical protein